MRSCRSLAVWLLCLCVAAPMLAAEGESWVAPRGPGGKPDLNGTWRAFGRAHDDLEHHPARAARAFREGPVGPVPAKEVVALGAVGAVPAGIGVVVGDEIPYQPWARKRRVENQKQWLTRDPEIKCYLPGIPRATYMPYPFQILHNEDALFFAYEYAGAVRNIHLSDPGPAPIDSWMGQSVGSWDGDTLVVVTTGEPAAGGRVVGQVGDAVQPRKSAAVGEFDPGPPGIEVGVAAAHRVLALVLSQPFGCECVGGPQEAEPCATRWRLDRGDEVQRDQFREGLDHVVRCEAISCAHGLDGREVRGAGEDGHPAKDLLPGGVEQVVTPGDGVACGPVTFWSVRSAATEHLEVTPDVVAQGLEQPVQSEHPQPRGREFDRQRQPVDEPARLRDLLERRFRPGEGSPGLGGAGEEQFHCR